MRKKFIDWLLGRSRWSIHWSLQTWCERHHNWHLAYCEDCLNEVASLVRTGYSMEQALDRLAERDMGEGYFA